VRVDPGNDPGRDEYGLPPVEVEIPDDARDLDRDVQAYHRELRARRRHLRIRRLTGPLTGHGMVVPLVAACLAVTLLTGTLLTVLAGRQVSLLPRAPLRTAPSSAAPRPAPRSSADRQLPSVPSVPDAQVTLAGQPTRLRTLIPAVLMWVPYGCACGAVLRQLARQTAQAGVRIYFVGTDRATGELPLLASQAGPQYRGMVVTDSTDALGIAYQPIGLTAILAAGDGSVTAPDVVRNLQLRLPRPGRQPPAAQQFGARLQVLAGHSRVPAAGPSARV
jgi:hypothetical protein